MLHSVGVKNYMLETPVKLRPGMSVFEASHLILSNKISGAVVVDETGHLLGMVSELDCLRAMLNAVYNGDEFVEGRVEDIMTKDVETAHRTMTSSTLRRRCSTTNTADVRSSRTESWLVS